MWTASKPSPPAPLPMGEGRNSHLLKHFIPTGLFPLTIGVLIFAVALVNSRVHGSAFAALNEQTPQTQMQFPEGLDYSKFQHSTAYHARLPCLLCHRRDSNAPVPKRPGGANHLPCAGCHAQQFSNSDSPICTICHTDVKSGALKSFPHLPSFRMKSGALKPFPGLRSFNMKFDHARHMKMGALTCATCHRSARGGVALSIPAGFNAHATCYRCHTGKAQSDGRDISSCGTCHQLGSYSRTPSLAQSFRVGFSHAKHADTACNACHQIRAGMPQRRQVTQPQPLHHHATGNGQSCLTCHDGKRAFGGDDFTACTRCHTGQAWRFGK